MSPVFHLKWLQVVSDTLHHWGLTGTSCICHSLLPLSPSPCVRLFLQLFRLHLQQIKQQQIVATQPHTCTTETHLFHQCPMRVPQWTCRESCTTQEYSVTLTLTCILKWHLICFSRHCSSLPLPVPVPVRGEIRWHLQRGASESFFKIKQTKWESSEREVVCCYCSASVRVREVKLRESTCVTYVLSYVRESSVLVSSPLIKWVASRVAAVTRRMVIWVMNSVSITVVSSLI